MGLILLVARGHQSKLDKDELKNGLQGRHARCDDDNIGFHTKFVNQNCIRSFSREEYPTLSKPQGEQSNLLKTLVR